MKPMDVLRKSNIVLEPAINVYSKEEYIRRISSIKKLAKIIQFDVIDGVFARPINFNDPKIIFHELDHSKVHLHLMVDNIEEEIKKWVKYRPKRITLHVESSDFSEKHLDFLKKEEIEAGIACVPSTPLEKIMPFINKVDFILLLSVPPGRNGQKFSTNAIERLRTLRTRFPEINLGVDGGINQQQIRKLVKTRVNTITMGSAIFNGDAAENLKGFSQLVSHF